MADNNSTTKRKGRLRGFDADGNPVITCRECGHTGHADNFQTDKLQPNGVQCLCIPCNRKKRRAWYAKNRTVVIERQKAYRNANRNYYFELDAASRSKNKEYWSTHEPSGIKHCPRCDKVKDAGDFYRVDSAKDGLGTYCKECWNDRQKERGHGYRKNWKILLEAQGYRCNPNGIKPGCGFPLYKGSEVDVDHIVPRAHGGSHEIDNLQVLCRDCNRKYGARMPEGYAIQ